MNKSFIAHKRKCDEKDQLLHVHLTEVGALAAEFSRKIKLAAAGRLMGLLHDFGKYSQEFQSYIQSATGGIDQDDEEWVDASLLKGKIDHSTAGAQYVWDKLSGIGGKAAQGELCAQILAVCIVSHHSGLIDCLNEDGENIFFRRMRKRDDKTHLSEAIRSADAFLLQELDSTLNKEFVVDLYSTMKRLADLTSQVDSGLSHEDAFSLGVFTRFLFSCLIDADRLNSAEFELPGRKMERIARSSYFQWSVAIERLEEKLKSFNADKPIDKIRSAISENCLRRSTEPTGVYTLSVPTGGGKTLASLRYALNHARTHDMDRVIYIIPYTSIIEQNAEVVRDIIEHGDDEFSWVLEHHSNIEPENETWRSKLVAENWDAPIVFTTMVQFLETLFSGGTRGARRMHQLANAVLIFDEIQTLPINCVHMFCNALNFLTRHAGTTAVLCTATQPLLDKLPRSKFGQLELTNNAELVDNKSKLFADLKRVEIADLCKPGGWHANEIFGLVEQRFHQTGSCLVIVNTKTWAKQLYESLSGIVDESSLFHLSTNLCPTHRKVLFSTIKSRLSHGLPVLCISTQLIEAGVDIDFASVVRFLAGLDSIAQAAGRCNRNGILKDKQGRLMPGSVEIVNPADEHIQILVDIVEGKECTSRVLDEFEDGDLLSPEVMDTYYKYFFFERQKAMVYPHGNDCLLNMLANNNLNPGSGNNQERRKKGKLPLLQQSFMAAGKAFKAIDAPTYSVIVPHGEGKQIIVNLCAADINFNPGAFYSLLKRAQQYSVNVFPNVWRVLLEKKAVIEVQGQEIYFLDERHYHKKFGLSIDGVADQDFYSV